MAKQHVENLNVHAVMPRPWAPAGLPGGASVRVLSEDPVTGGVTAVVELPADFDSKLPVAPDMEIQCFVLDGRLQLGEKTLPPGGYCFHPPGSPMGQWQTRDVTRVLVIASASPSFHPTASKVCPPDAIELVDSFAAEWIDPLKAADPSTTFRTGICVKVLRVDAVTGGTTHLAGLLPGWFMPGMEVHPVYEENYCLCGDVHIADIAGHAGYTMTEGAFLCRPPGIAHGPVVSKNGNVNLVYAHGRLGIDYVEHPNAKALIDSHLYDSPWR
jgi:hypothetical protein